MKIAGRKTSAAYELYGFIPRVANGKHSAICMACNRILQNTAAVRLERHRNACSARPLLGHPAHFQNFELKTDGSNSSFVVEDESIAKEPEHKAQPIRYKRTDGSNSRFVVEDESIAKEPDHKAQPIHYKRRCYASKVEEVQRDERINLNIKTENNDIGLEDTNLDDDANGNTTSEDAVENFQYYIPSSKYTRKGITDDKLKAKIKYFKESSKYFLKFEKTMMVLKIKKLSLEIRQEATNSSRRLHKYPTNDERNNIYSVLHKSKEPCDTSYQDEYSIQSPVATLQLSPEPFESHHAVTNPASTSGLDIDDENQEVNDEDLINIEEELDALQNLMPRSKESKQLQDELSKAETEYYRCKAAYFTKLTENCSIKKNLMLLESRKLQLEIEKLTKES